MDSKLRLIAGNKPAGQYFIVSDESNAEQIMPNENVRIAFLNERLGNSNTAIYFKRGSQTAFKNMFGKRNRRAEKQGNFGIKECLKMLEKAPLIVVNLRAFDDTLDRTQIANMGANKQWGISKEIPYSKLFDKKGFWSPNTRTILKPFGADTNLLNFANVGEGDVSIMVVSAQKGDVDNVTKYGNESIIDATQNVDIDEFPAIVNDQNKLLSDTFVTVYIFKNNFADKLDNVTYKHLFNESGLINQSDIEALTRIRTSGYVAKYTGSLIPYAKEGTTNISIDAIMNQYYQETGVYCAINDDVLEYDSYIEQPVINTLYSGYHDEKGVLIDDGNMLSYRFQSNPENIAKVTLGTNESNTNFRDKEILIYDGDIFPENGENLNRVYGILENGVRYGDVLTFKDKDTQKMVDTNVIQMSLDTEITKEIPKLESTNITFDLTIENGKPKIVIIDKSEIPNVKYNILRKRVGEDNFVALRTDSDLTFIDTGATNSASYVYAILYKHDDFSDNVSSAKSIKVLDGEVSKTASDTYPLTVKTISYKRVILTTDKNINSDSYMRRLRLNENKNLKVEMTTLNGYVQRPEQFVNGTPKRQNEILDVMNSPSIVGGIVKLGNVGYIIDTFKSYVESGYKRQIGNLIDELDECNRFVTAIINEPFVYDLDESTNPLFKETPNGDLDLGSYLAQGGNPNFSTSFLTKFVTKIEMCAFYGAEEDSPNVYPLAGEISNLFVDKPNAWSIVANSKGILPIAGVEIDGDTRERKAMEDFGWNPIIKLNGKFRIFGDRSGQSTNSSLRDFSNAELLKYIKTELLNMSMDDAFTKGTYDELNAFETRIKTFMDGLALQLAIKPNPSIKVLEVNNKETEQARIKLCEIEYENYNTLDKVVFSLKLK